MNISDLMKKLQTLKEEHGDLKVTGDYGDPEVALIKQDGDYDDICIYIG